MSGHLLRLAAVATLLLPLPTPVGAFWRMGCSKIITARIDPVIFPGQISGHTHTIVGASNIGVDSTFDTLSDSACTSCEIQADKSAYWTPQLYYEYANGSFVDVHHDGSVVYYLGRGDNATTIPFPEGFRMLSGNPSLRSFDNASYTWGDADHPPRPIAEAVTFVCLGEQEYEEVYGPLNNSYWEPFDCYNGLRAQMQLPTCWDGVNLYLPDQSHVAHLSQIDNGACPPTHPYQMPHLFIETLYSIDSVKGDTAGGRFVFAMGDPTGYGFHADFYNGWNTGVLTSAIENCLSLEDAPDGTISECPVLQASDTNGYSTNCPEKASPIDEVVTGLLGELPGCNPVTDGPVGPLLAVCPSKTTPSITPTANSVAQYTVQPAVGGNYPAESAQEYLGCFNDTYNGLRALGEKSTSSSFMDIPTCQSFCNNAGYQLSGVEYSNECHCGNEISNNANENDTIDGYSQCTWLCAGTIAAENGTQEICGGYGFISIYKSTDLEAIISTDLPPSTTGSSSPSSSPPASSEAPASDFVGCVSDASSSRRTLSGASFADSSMTVERCGQFARTGNNGAGFRYYGLEYSRECYVGNTILPGGEVLTSTSSPPSSRCDMSCAGDSTEVCGGPSVMSVYFNTDYTADSEAVSSIGTYTSQGCLTDAQAGTNLRALDGSFNTDGAMTEELCVSTCQKQGYQYAGLEYSTQCICGNDIINGGQSVDCNSYELFACPGNNSQLCGGSSVMNLFLSTIS